ncbi:MAG: hypothetical protein AAGH79_14020 [Bacteroidota bacterium]
MKTKILLFIGLFLGVLTTQAQDHHFEGSLDLYGHILRTTGEDTDLRLRLGQSVGLSLGRRLGDQSFLTIGSMLANGGTRSVSDRTCYRDIAPVGQTPDFILQRYEQLNIQRDFSIEGYLSYRYTWGQGRHPWFVAGRGIIRYVLLEQYKTSSECPGVWVHENVSWSRFAVLEMELGAALGLGKIWRWGPFWALQTEWRTQMFWQEKEPDSIQASGLQVSLTRMW